MRLFPSTGRLLSFSAMVMALAVLAPPASAQIQAEVEIGGSGDSPHPVTFTWAGDAEPVYDPVTRYTFFYTGTVLGDATVPIESQIERIPVSSLEWEQNKSFIISRYLAFFDGFEDIEEEPRGFQIDRGVELDENFNYVDTTPAPAARQRSQGEVDSEAAAEWAFYYDQLVLWQYYNRRVMLNEPNAIYANESGRQFTMRQDRRVVRDLMRTGEIPEGLTEEQLLVALAERRGEVIEDARLLQGQDLELRPIATEFDAHLDYQEPRRIERLREEFLNDARALERRARSVYMSILNDVEEREADQMRLADWRASKRQDLYNFVEAWDQVQRGERETFGDTFFLITEDPVEDIPGSTRNVVVRKKVTPQDILTEEGELQSAEYETYID